MHRVAQVGRAAGVVLLLAMQRLSATNISTDLRALSSLNICLKCRSAQDSQMVIVSEELGEIPVHEGIKGRDLVVLLDELDGTLLFLHGVPLAGHAISFILPRGEVLLSMVADPFSGLTYWTRCDVAGAYVRMANGEDRRIRTSDRRSIREEWISSYALTHERKDSQAFREVSELPSKYLFTGCGGTMEIVRIARSSEIDCLALVEKAKGFRSYDLIPAAHILKKAGGVVLDLDGNPISMDPFSQGRQMFIAAANDSIYHEVAELLSAEQVASKKAA